MDKVVVPVDVFARAETVWTAFGAPKAAAAEAFGSSIVVHTDNELLARLLEAAPRGAGELLRLISAAWPVWAIRVALYEAMISASYRERAAVAVLAVIADMPDIAQYSTLSTFAVCAIQAARELLQWLSSSSRREHRVASGGS